ncbi:MAG: c-type cytochrome [Opitutae bacterium]|jgi:cytochrome c553|nr:c-type cytochrome [Opitutae bacterium]
MSRHILIVLLISGSCTLMMSCLPESKIAEPQLTLTDQERGEALVAECMLCHSNKEAQRGPILHGMETWYLIDQLEKFRSGVRGNLASNRSEYLMGIGAKKIQSDYELVYVANWFSEQDPLPAIRTIKGDIEDGQSVYVQRCVSCHGENGEGNRQFVAPSLQRLEGWYFLEQMRKFRSGQRGYHIKDIGGQSMAAASNEISDRTLRNVVAYCIDAFGPEEEISERDRLVPRGARRPF